MLFVGAQSMSAELLFPSFPPPRPLPSGIVLPSPRVGPAITSPRSPRTGAAALSAVALKHGDGSVSPRAYSVDKHYGYGKYAKPPRKARPEITYVEKPQPWMHVPMITTYKRFTDTFRLDPRHIPDLYAARAILAQFWRNSAQFSDGASIVSTGTATSTATATSTPPTPSSPTR